MRNNVAHFAVNADDVARARKFYEQVFGWKLEAWGPPDFFMIQSTSEDGPGIMGSLQKRREIVPGVAMRGFECTLAVDDIDRTIALVEKAGGKIVMAKSTIVGVGRLVFFQDTEGNIAGAMQYDPKAA